MIISASRRTDIPALYSEWFINRLKEGYVLTRNPMNHAQISRIKLSPETIDCIVFWTKDPGPMLEQLSLLDQKGYKYYFQFTLTPYGQELEPNLRTKQELLKTFMRLSERIGRERVLWRYDPIIITDSHTIEYHLEKINDLCGRLADYTEICTISFIDLYAKIKSNKGLSFREVTEDEMFCLAKAFSEAGSRYGLSIRSCCEKMDLSPFGIIPASCIDQRTIERICGYSIEAKRDGNQRPGCGCIQSIDIGSYNTCPNGCRYCYANAGVPSAMKNYLNHNPASAILLGTIGEGEHITDRPVKSLRCI